MIKKELVFFGLFVLMIGFASADCILTSSLINQDPHPAVPGDYVTLVFQLEGVENYECQEVTFELVESYPIVFDPGTTHVVSVKGGTFVQDYVSYLRIPYKVRVDSNAVDGDNKIEVKYRHSKNGPGVYSKQSFNLSIEDVKTTFEVYVKNYDPSTGKITFEILNTGKGDVEALTLEVKNQDSITLRGPSTKIIGSLDSNDFTTTDLEAIATKGNIEVTIYYTDSIDERRTYTETVEFDPQPFVEKQKAEQKTPFGLYVAVIIVILGLAYYFYRRHKRMQRHHLMHKGKN